MNPIPGRDVDIKVCFNFFEDIRVRVSLIFRRVAYSILAGVCGVALLVFVVGIISSETSDALKANVEGMKYILSILGCIFILPLLPSLKRFFKEEAYYRFSENGFEVDGVHKKWSDFQEVLETFREFILVDDRNKLVNFNLHIIPKRSFRNQEHFRNFTKILRETSLILEN